MTASLLLPSGTAGTWLVLVRSFNRQPVELFAYELLAVLGSFIFGEVLVDSDQPQDLSCRGLKVEMR